MAKKKKSSNNKAAGGSPSQNGGRNDVASSSSSPPNNNNDVNNESRILLTLHNPRGSNKKVSYKVKPSTQFLKVSTNYKTKYSSPQYQDELVFVYNGRLIVDQDTPESLGIRGNGGNEGVAIDVMTKG